MNPVQNDSVPVPVPQNPVPPVSLIQTMYSQPLVPPIPLKPKKSHTFIWLLLGSVLLVLVLGGAATFAYVNHLRPSDAPTPVESVVSAVSISTSTISAGYSRYIEPSVGLFELNYPTGWDVKTTPATSTEAGGAEISPSKTAGILDPLISIDIQQAPSVISKTNFQGIAQNFLLSLIKQSKFSLSSSSEMTLGGDQAFYVAYTAPQYGIRGMYVYALASGTPDLDIIGSSPSFNAPFVVALQYKSATSTYSEGIENTIISSFKEHFLNNGVLGQPYKNQLLDCLAGNLEQPPIYCFVFALPASNTFKGVMDSCMALPDDKYVTKFGQFEKAAYYPTNFSYQEYCVFRLGVDIISPQHNDASNDFQKQFFANQPLPTYNSKTYIKDMEPVSDNYKIEICKNYGNITHSNAKTDRCLLPYLNQLPDAPYYVYNKNLFCNALSSKSLSPECK